jgi:WD40 repeat protein
LTNIDKSDKGPGLHSFIHDARRFIVYSRSIIEQAPLQAYCSALVFAPEKSIVRETFKRYIPSWIQRKPRVETYWNAMLQTLEGHTSAVSSVAFSPDGKQIVSGSADRTVRRWDAATGQQLLPALEGHTDCVSSVAFSPNGKQIPTLRVSENWLAEGTTNLLWLPPGYRPTCEATWDGVIALGHQSGGVSILQLQLGPKLMT